MNRSARAAIRDDVLADYQEPRPGLAIRALRAIPVDEHPLPALAPKGRDTWLPRRRRETVQLALQTLAVVVAALVVAAAVVGVRVARGEMALPSDAPLGLGGLHPPAASYAIVEFQSVSANVGWIVAQLHEHKGPTVLMATIDGGKTWHEQFRIPDRLGLGGIHFWNPRDGELVEDVPSNLPPTKTPGAPGSSSVVPRVYRTTDGGAHWQLIDRPVDWANIHNPSFFLTPQVGWRLSGEPLSFTARAVQQTVDGGAYWATLATIHADLLGAQLVFRDAQNGWIVTSQELTHVLNGSRQRVPAGVQQYGLYATHDGGRTWTRQDLPLLADAAAAKVFLSTPLFFNDEDGILPFAVIPSAPDMRVAPRQMMSQLNKPYVVQTHDGGVHWSGLVETQGAVPDGEVFFLDSKHWLTADGPSIRQSFDAGQTWTAPQQVLANGLSFSFNYWNHINASVIWAQVGSSSIVRSTDGGATWTAVSLPAIK